MAAPVLLSLFNSSMPRRSIYKYHVKKNKNGMGLTKEEFVLGCAKVEKRRTEQLHELRERYLADIHEVDRIYNIELGQLRTEYTGDTSIAKIGDTITDGMKTMKVEDVSIDDGCNICYLGKKMVGRKVVGKEVSGMYEKDIFKVNGIQVPGRESRRKKQTTKRNIKWKIS